MHSYLNRDGGVRMDAEGLPGFGMAPEEGFPSSCSGSFLPKSIWTQQSRLSVGSFFNHLSIVYKHLRIGFLCIEPAKNIRTLTAFVVVF